MNSSLQDSSGCVNSGGPELTSPTLPPSDLQPPPLQRKRTVSLLGVPLPSFDATVTSFTASNGGQAISFEAPSEGSVGAGSGFMRVSARSETLSVTIRSDDEGTLVRSTVVDIDEPFFCNGPRRRSSGSFALPTLAQSSSSRKPSKPRRRNMTLGYVSQSDDDTDDGEEDLFATFRSLSPQQSQSFASRLRSSGNCDSPPPQRAHVDAVGIMVDLFEDHTTSPADGSDTCLDPLSADNACGARQRSASVHSHSSSSDTTGQQISVPCMDEDGSAASSEDDPELDRPPGRQGKSTADCFFAVDCPLKPD